MKKNILMVAFHMPPAAMGSGHLRPLGFATYLPLFGWSPVILSARQRAYPFINQSSVNLIPKTCRVYRSFALDARRHFGLWGKYPAFLAQPDRWSSWWPAAVWQGLRLIRKYNIRVIWSTYPIMTAHCVAYTLSRLTGLSWIADFRDPVTSSVSLENRYAISSQRRWEQRVVTHATHSVFTTPGALRLYAERYPQIHRQGRMTLIPNGFDEAAIPNLPPAVDHQPGRPLRLLHSGILYRSGRNPVPFLTALARLKKSGVVTADELSVTLRASGSVAEYGAEIKRLELNDMVKLAPAVSYQEALSEQAYSDALLLFQGEQYDYQIPIKLYEYLRIGRPIFALIGEHGDTAAVLRDTGGAEIVSPDNVAIIQERLVEFLRALREGRAPTVNKSAIQHYSRKAGTEQLAELLDRMASHNSTV